MIQEGIYGEGAKNIRVKIFEEENFSKKEIKDRKNILPLKVNRRMGYKVGVRAISVQSMTLILNLLGLSLATAKNQNCL